jgi:MFS family permease
MIMLINHFGWQASLLIAAIFGLLIGIILWIYVVDPRNDTKEIKHFSVKESLLMTVKEKQNWFCGLFMCLLNLPFPILGALFGTIFIAQVYNYSYVQSASISSMLFIGMIFGGPFFGWLSMLLKSNKKLMLFGSALCLVTMLFILYFPIHNFYVLHLLFFILGFTCSAQLLAYPIISRINSPQIGGSALSLASLILTAIGYNIGIPLTGEILSSFWDGKIVNGIHIYSLQAYQKAFMLIPIGIIISIVLLFFIKEKKEKASEKKS